MYQPVKVTEPMLKSKYGTEMEKNEEGVISPMRMEAPVRPSFQDVPFAILFIINLIIITAFALTKGLTAIKTALPDEESVPSDQGNYGHLVLLIGSISGVALLLAVTWVNFLLSWSEQLIRFSLWLNVGLMIAMACTTFVVTPIMSLVFMFFAAINVCYIYAVENRIAFASTNLKCACKAISSHKGIIGVGIALLLLQFLWVMTWSVGTIGVYQMFRESTPNCAEIEKRGEICGGSGLGVALFFVLLSLYWGQQVIQNILTCTTAGTVATWWYQEHPQLSSTAVVTGALWRSVTTSFGSICFGSLLVAFVQALRTMARSLREKAEREDSTAMACVACLAECLLSCVESILEYINQWALCYVGIYGFDFATSGKAVMSLFQNRGWTAVINDDLTSSALGIGALGVALVSGAVATLLASFAPSSWLGPLASAEVSARCAILGSIGLVSGLAMALVLGAVITSALHTVFVCFAEDPSAFQRTHPELYTSLTGAWKQFHPDAWGAVAYADYA